MSDSDLIDNRMVHETVVRPLIPDDNEVAADSGRSTARGIMTAVVISASFWALIAFAIYRAL